MSKKKKLLPSAQPPVKINVQEPPIKPSEEKLEYWQRGFFKGCKTQEEALGLAKRERERIINQYTNPQPHHLLFNPKKFN